MSLPIIIQGGMGVGVSNWTLARAVSREGQLGVVSGTLLPVVLARRLQLGDAGGHMRRALAHFPVPGVADRILSAYFVAGGIEANAPFKPTPMPALPPSPAFVELTMAANFVEVFLAKEGHAGLVGLNLLEKIQIPTLASLYGAMLAGVDYVLMGAGVPRAIPGVLDELARGDAARLKIDVTREAAAAGPAPEVFVSLNPSTFFPAGAPRLRRPRFLAVVGSAALATTLARKASGRVDGFVVENEVAGGHNAPPRGPLQLTPGGEPIYGERDRPELEKFRALGLPFWLAGSQASAEKLAEARRLGAVGVQIGTAFAFCEEAGVATSVKRAVCADARSGHARVRTDPSASPTGFPFKVLRQPGTLSEPEVYAERTRVCDLGYLRETFAKADGTLGHRCAGEPVADFARKGGCVTDTCGRKCLCNGLLATVGLGQRHAGGSVEPVLITAGNEIAGLSRFLGETAPGYGVATVLTALLAPGET